jgi:hypothetical protein
VVVVVVECDAHGSVPLVLVVPDVVADVVVPDVVSVVVVPDVVCAAFETWWW